MPEVKKQVRLVKAATDFNVGRTTIIEFLKKKGFEIVNKPTTKLTAEMYELLEKEYQSQKVIREQADAISFGPKNRENVELEEGKIKRTKKPEDQKVILIQTSGVQNIEPETKKAEETGKKLEKEKPGKKELAEPEKPEVVGTPETKLKGTKVVGKVDLEKFTTKKRAAKKTIEEEKAISQSKKSTEEESVVEEKEKLTPQKDQEAKIEDDTQADKKIAETKEKRKQEPPVEKTVKIKLHGPKVLGKIDFPIEDKKKKEKERETEIPKKRKRKRVRTQKVDLDKKQESKSKFDGDYQKDRGKRRGRKDLIKGKPEVTEQEIQEKIKETQAKLSSHGSGRGKATRKKKHVKKIERIKNEAQSAESINEIQVTEFISVSELANLLDVTPTEIISKCMSFGVIVSINQRLDAEIIELVANEFGYEVKFIDIVEQEEIEEEEEDRPEDLCERPPIVTIMGHVDHGKTSLLDYIRESSIVAGEQGGITQHIGAYEVTTDTGKGITFLDTPGHEAFTAMRARGAKITDIAVIVIAADDAVMPQTKEAISHAQAAGVPMIFAINKIDKDNAQPDKIREQLAQMDLLVEEWGGKFQCQEISAKKGLHIDELMEKILLEAEMLELKANPNRAATGTVLEATLDKGRGYVTTILVQNGTLKKGDLVLAGTHYGRIKAMFNERGGKIKKAGPSSPVLILGLNGAPQAGDTFKVMASEQEVKQIANKRSRLLREQGLRTKKHITLEEIGRRLALGTFKELNIILKADVDGSLEALADSLEKLSTDEIHVNIVHRGVGQITESDVLLASASDAIIVGFQVRPSISARKLAERENIEIRLYSIIYDAIKEIKSAMEGMLEPTIEEEIIANVEVRKIYKISKVGTVAGCYVLNGKIKHNARVRIIRDGIVVYTGELASLKRFKDDVKEVAAHLECGLNIKNFNDIKVGDIIEAFEEVEVERKL